MNTRKKTMGAAYAILTMLLGMAALTEEAGAQNNSCRHACWQAYGACYKATNSRVRCQVKLKRCLDGCIRRKR